MSTSKVLYRNSSGCCICRTKSSSSRFTNSRRYESSFEACFLVSSLDRCGWICNSCVLIVKRFRKNPHKQSGIRNWSHKIDSRAGPGSKPKPPSRSSPVSIYKSYVELGSSPSSSSVKKYSTSQSSTPTRRTRTKNSLNKLSYRFDYFEDEDDTWSKSSAVRTGRKSSQVRRFNAPHPHETARSFIDHDYYHRLVKCCGEGYVGHNREILATIQPGAPCSSHPCSLWSSLLSVCSQLRTEELISTSSSTTIQQQTVPTKSIVSPDGTSSVSSGYHSDSYGSDRTAVLLSRVSQCLSGLNRSDALDSDCHTIALPNKLKIGNCDGSETSSGIQSRAMSDLGEEVCPMSVESDEYVECF